ncbi:metalloprotease-like protein [Sphaerisporangium album]|uniref:Metalloprotease-like protein n=1 Tax=Sphaerisporangium album TaxID=509200 RepID=A0A367FJU2_9ACTN|nr:neutral zinc metallopeptidase [Sphaerisporangium album]RCG30531.1 metalloprotease-like protein [Sphaerisporangium album]
MRKVSFVVLLALVAPLLFQGTSWAYPIKNAPVLTRSPLYSSGPLPRTSCPEQPVEAGDVASVKRYLMPLVTCLDAVWTTHFKKAGLPFTKPTVRFITKPQRACGEKWGKYVQAIYCNPTHEIVFLLDKSIMNDPEDLFLMDVIAHEYGHHVQNAAGMWKAYDRLTGRNRAEFNEQTRRHELQAECLAGAFIGSVWGSLDRTTDDWRTLLDADRRSGDETTDVRDHGKGRNIANWLNRGFKTAGPSACNTWIAGAPMVG